MQGRPQRQCQNAAFSSVHEAVTDGKGDRLRAVLGLADL
jgi:hypothetical protein